MRRFLVFGKSGQLARALAQHPGVVTMGRNTVDLAAPDSAAEVIATTDCDAVINAAAYTAVDQAETEEALATRINGDAVGEMAKACAACDLPFVTVSTDYVFDGTGTDPWCPDNPTTPCNSYGRSKRVGELAALAAGGRAAVVRTSWVYDVEGRNFVTTMLRLGAERPNLSVVDDQIGGPTPASALAEALIHIANALVEGRGAPGLYHFAGTPDVSWAAFAEAIFATAGLPTSVTPIPSADFSTPAKRPANSRLDCRSLETAFGLTRPDWRDDLRLSLADKKGDT
ncbi:dTDP-4-dehydrorhamnose reductase [Halovulum sp. GXIMD14793]